MWLYPRVGLPGSPSSTIEVTMAKVKGAGAAVRGTSYKNEFPKPDVYTMYTTYRKERPPKGAPTYKKGGSVKKDKC